MHKVSQNNAGQGSLLKIAVWLRFKQKPEAGHFLSGKIFAPGNFFFCVDSKNVVFRKPDNRTKNRILESGN